MNLIAPWTIVVGNTEYESNALASIDATIDLVELNRKDEKTASHVQNKFEQSWISRYPWPEHCVHDNGGEFTGLEFQQLLSGWCNIKDIATTSCNPQANAICERIHQSVGNVLLTLLYANPTQNLDQANELINSTLATATHAMQANVYLALDSFPGALAFGRDVVVMAESDSRMDTETEENGFGSLR